MAREVKPSLAWCPGPSRSWLWPARQEAVVMSLARWWQGQQQKVRPEPPLADQFVAIARAVSFGAKVLVLDEPTSALGVKQADVVLRYSIQAREQGVGVIFSADNLHHADTVGDSFVILTVPVCRQLPQVRHQLRRTHTGYVRRA
jgi:ABC-type sugar transport system ATPase subunit